jgi:hypothetical protein
MTNNKYIIAAVISISFLLIKFLEMRFIEKENKPLKLLLRDTLLVYFSVIVSYFIIEQLKPSIIKGGKPTITPIFTDNPNF